MNIKYYGILQVDGIILILRKRHGGWRGGKH